MKSSKETLDLLREYAERVLEEAMRERMERHVAPEGAYLHEMLMRVNDDFKETLREKVRNRELICHSTINTDCLFQKANP